MSFFHMLAGTISSGGDDINRLLGVTVTDSAFTAGSGINVGAFVLMNSDASVDYVRTVVADIPNAQTWVIPTANASNYHIRSVLTSAPPSVSSTALITTWQPMTSNYLTGMFANNVIELSESCTIRIDLSDDGGTTTVHSATFTFNLSVQNLGGA